MDSTVGQGGVPPLCRYLSNTLVHPQTSVLPLGRLGDVMYSRKDSVVVGIDPFSVLELCWRKSNMLESS